MRPRRCVVGAVLASLAWSTSSQAAPPSTTRTPIRVELEESLPQECKSSIPILDRVRARTERIERTTANNANAKVRVSAHREGNRLLGELIVEEPAGRTERTVSAPSCEDVLAAFAVMLVVALDHEALEPKSPTEGAETETKTEPTPIPEALPGRPRPLARVRPTRIEKPVPRSRLVLSGGIGIGLPGYEGLIFEPNVTIEGRLETAFQPRLRATLARTAHDSVATRSARVDLVWTTGRVSFCGGPGWLEAHHLALCAGSVVGELQATVVRAGGPARGLLWAAAGPSVLLDLELGWRLGFQVEAGFTVPMLRDRFYFEPRTMAYQAPAIVPFIGFNLLSRVLPLRD